MTYSTVTELLPPVFSTKYEDLVTLVLLTHRDMCHRTTQRHRDINPPV